MKRFFPIIFVLFFAFVGGFALLSPGLPPTHDGEYHVVRFYQFNKVLREGNLYPRWAPDLNKGYGVPLFNYVYPLPNYAASLFHFFGFSFIDAFKLSMFVATIIGSIFFYLWSRQYWGDTGGVVSAVFYTFSPYRFVDIYIRGSVGEVWALAFFPAFLWAITKCLIEKNLLFALISGIFLAMIIFSHNILALMFFPFAVSYMGLLVYIGKNKKYLILNTLYIILFGLSLSVIFWLPALFEKDYVVGLQVYDIAKNFPELYQLLIPSWGSGFLDNSLHDKMSYQIGIANLLAATTSTVAIFFFYKKKERRKVTLVIFSLIWLFIAFFLMISISFPIWKTIPLISYFQFPWRLLSLVILLCSFLAGGFVAVWKSRVILVFFVLMPVLLGIGYAKPAYYHQRNDRYYFTRSNFIDGTNSPGNSFNTLWFDTTVEKKNEKASIVKGKSDITPVFIKSTQYRFRINAKSESSVAIHTAYFPGWTVFVDGKSQIVSRDKNGLMQFHISEGNHVVDIEYKHTKIQEIATILSLFSLIIGLSFLIYKRVIIKK